MTHPLSIRSASRLTLLYILGWLATPPSFAVAQLPVDLGTLGGHYSEALAISDTGQVVGDSTVVDNRALRAFSWTAEGGMIDLGPFDSSQSRAVAVNNHGQVVGNVDFANATKVRAFSWTKETGMVELGTLGGVVSEAVAINDRGEVVGRSTTSEGTYHAFLWTMREGMIDLGPFGGTYSDAVAINQHGQVIGESSTPSSFRKPFLWTRVDGMIDVLADKFLSATFSAINNRGQIVGQFADHAFSYAMDTGLIELGPPEGSTFVRAINDRGQIVGGGHNAPFDGAMSFRVGQMPSGLGILRGWQDSDAGDVNEQGLVIGNSIVHEREEGVGFNQALAWTATKHMIGLPSGNGTQSVATALNNRGQVVGLAETRDGWRAVMWVIGAHARTRPPIADAYVQAGRFATQNFGTSSTLQAKKGIAADNTRQCYLKFDISGIADADTLTLQLYGHLSSDADRNVGVLIFGVADSSWDEEAITWNSKPSYQQALGLMTVAWLAQFGDPATGPGVFAGVDLTAYVQTARRAGKRSISVMLRAPVHTSAYVSFDAREAGETGPQLVISR